MNSTECYGPHCLDQKQNLYLYRNQTFFEFVRLCVNLFIKRVLFIGLSHWTPSIVLCVTPYPLEQPMTHSGRFELCLIST